jgi:hypothetical protein
MSLKSAGLHEKLAVATCLHRNMVSFISFSLGLFNTEVICFDYLPSNETIELETMRKEAVLALKYCLGW